MYITGVEAALAGSAITAASGAVTGLIVQRTTANRDHLARLWERRIELYDAIALSVDQNEEVAVEAMRLIQKRRVAEARAIVRDIKKDRALESRINLLSEERVQIAYSKYLDAFGTWQYRVKETGDDPPAEQTEDLKIWTFGKLGASYQELNKRAAFLVSTLAKDTQYAPGHHRIGWVKHSLGWRWISGVK